MQGMPWQLLVQQGHVSPLTCYMEASQGSFLTSPPSSAHGSTTFQVLWLSKPTQHQQNQFFRQLRHARSATR